MSSFLIGSSKRFDKLSNFTNENNFHIPNMDNLFIDEQAELIFTYNNDNNKNLKQHNFYFKDAWVISVIGDLIDYNVAPYEDIIQAIEKNNFEKIKMLSGIFFDSRLQ